MPSTDTQTVRENALLKALKNKQTETQQAWEALLSRFLPQRNTAQQGTEISENMSGNSDLSFGNTQGTRENALLKALRTHGTKAQQNTAAPDSTLSDLVQDSAPLTVDGVNTTGYTGSTTEGAGETFSNRIYTPVEYKGTVKVNGEVKDVSRRVYQRNDININYLDATTGLTNLERMQAGKPPIGSDGNPIELHHILQQEVGPMAELQEITHQAYYSQLHGLVGNGASFRNNPLLNKQYNNFRYNYWKWRANLIVGGN